MLEKTRFFRAENNPSALPKNNAGVFFAGRSNVGKSSVINALCKQKNLARTAKRPGRTRSLNVYEVSYGKWLIDLPGYGFARVSKKEKESWQAMIEGAILGLEGKKRVYIIIDAFVGPTELDLAMAFWLSDNGIDYKIAANKCDKIPSDPNQEKSQILDLSAQKTAEIFKTEKSRIFIVSAREKFGFEPFRKDIADFL